MPRCIFRDAFKKLLDEKDGRLDTTRKKVSSLCYSVVYTVRTQYVHGTFNEGPVPFWELGSEGAPPTPQQE